jgi:hypothetical protein
MFAAETLSLNDHRLMATSKVAKVAASSSSPASERRGFRVALVDVDAAQELALHPALVVAAQGALDLHPLTRRREVDAHEVAVGRLQQGHYATAVRALIALNSSVFVPVSS